MWGILCLVSNQRRKQSLAGFQRGIPMLALLSVHRCGDGQRMGSSKANHAKNLI